MSGALYSGARVECGALKRVLQNEFSWSKSRHEKFSECRRAYFFHYYGSWGGWDERAEEKVRNLYVLKRLSNRYTWAGSVVHEAVRGALTSLRFGREVTLEATLERARRTMREDFAFSRAKSYWSRKHRKEFSGLVEHEYDEPVPDAEWKTNWETVQGALSWFFGSRWLGIARGLSPKQWLEVDVMDFERSIFHLEGVKIFAVPDFAFLEPDGGAVVVDWKTGRAREGYDDQVLGYALYLHNRYQVPLERMQAVLVYLNEGVETQVRIEPTAVDRFRRNFSESSKAMRELLVDAATNTALPEEAFARTEELEACARCVFRRPCGRSGG